MGKIAFVFAGQGAQYAGMGRELYEASPAARAAFDRAESLRPGTLEMCFSGPAEALSVTANTQPCLFAMDYACAAAAREAVLRGRASVFVYPLRALVADQSFHLRSFFAKLGIGVAVLTGATDQAERDRVFSGIARGSIDIVLTTPEFLAIHAGRFAATGRVGFAVVDEAHHVEEGLGGTRSAYLEFPRVLRELGSPCVLAATATATERTVRQVGELLGIENVVADDAVRDNLRLDDERDLSSRENRLVSIVAEGEKCLVYVNSRDQSISLARTLRRRIPELGQSIAFYNAGLTPVQRARVEEAFRAGEVTCVVSTSAFGEGVNLPDVRHVVLYHMPF